MGQFRSLRQSTKIYEYIYTYVVILNNQLWWGIIRERDNKVKMFFLSWKGQRAAPSLNPILTYHWIYINL